MTREIAILSLFMPAKKRKTECYPRGLYFPPLTGAPNTDPLAIAVSQTGVDLFDETISDPSSFQGFGEQDRPTSRHSEDRWALSPTIDQSGPRRRQFSGSRSTSPEPHSKTERRSYSWELVEELAISVKQSESGVASTLVKISQSLEAINHWLSAYKWPQDHAAQHSTTVAFDRQSSGTSQHSLPTLPRTAVRPTLSPHPHMAQLTPPVQLPEYFPTPRFQQGETATEEEDEE